MAETTGQPEPGSAPEPAAPPPDPAAAPPEPASGTTTALADPNAAPAGPGPATWPDDWKDKIASGDEKVRARLERFGSPTDVWKSFTNMETRFKQGGAANPFPDDGSDEDKAAWRAEAGIPETPDGYNTELSDGLVIGDQDKPIVDAYLSQAHAANESPETVQRNLDWYFSMREQEIQDRAAKDDENKIATQVLLREEYGKDMQRNLNAAFNLLDLAGDDVKAQIMSARLPNGNALGNDVDVLRFLTNLALDVNPAATVVNTTSGAPLTAITDEMAEIEKAMQDTKGEYYTGPKDPKTGETQMSTRYRELVEAKEKIDARDRDKS